MTPAWMDVGAFGVGHVARWNGREGDIEWFVDREPSLHTRPDVPCVVMSGGGEATCKRTGGRNLRTEVRRDSESLVPFQSCSPDASGCKQIDLFTKPPGL